VITPGLWYHVLHPISSTLIVNDFGVKYVDKADIDHLIDSIKKTYTLTKDWTGTLYCSVALAWDYKNRAVDILLPGYIKMKLQEYNHIQLKKIQTYPNALAPKQFSTEAQCLLLWDDSPPPPS
jgi:hypothetical protein